MCGEFMALNGSTSAVRTRFMDFKFCEQQVNLFELLLLNLKIISVLFLAVYASHTRFLLTSLQCCNLHPLNFIDKYLSP